MLKKFQSFLNRASSLQPKTKRYKQLLNGVSAPPFKGIGRTEWILSRPLYRFARFDLKSIAKPQRVQAVVLQIRQWAPFAKTGWYLLWDKDHALVWAWDTERVTSAILKSRLTPKTTAVVPETLFHKRQVDGSYLLESLEGYEGQIWQDDSLISSRWWLGLPSAGEWINFQRDAGTLPEHQSNMVPKPIPTNWTEKPWGKSASMKYSTSYGRMAESWIVPIAALCLCMMTIWHVARLTKLNTAIAEQSAELAALNLRAEPVMRARGQALDALNRISQLQATDPFPDQVSVMAMVAQTLPKNGVYLKEWEFLSGKLKITIASPTKLVSSTYIKLFQGMGIFQNVQALPISDPGSLALSMETVPNAAIDLAAENSEPKKADLGAVSVIAGR